MRGRNGSPAAWLRRIVPWKYPQTRVVCPECGGKQIVWRETVVVPCPVCEERGWVMRRAA